MAKKRYDWGDKKGAVHSRPKRTPQQLGQAVERKRENIRLNDPAAFTAPQTYGQALAEGNRVAGYQFDPQIQAVDLQERQSPVWYQNYRNSIQTPQQTATQYAPMIQQQQAVAQQTAAPTQGVDPSSQAGQQDAQAAKAREALAQLGVVTLQAQQGATTDYNAGRAGVARAAEIGTNAQLASQRQSLVGQRGATAAQYVSDARKGERDYGLAQQHQLVENKAFGLDVQKAQADVKTDRAKIRATAKTNRQKTKAEGQKVNTYGYSNEQWQRFSPSHRQRIMRQQKTSTGGDAKPKFTPQQTSKSNIELRKAVGLVQAGRKLPSGRDPGYWGSAYDQLVADGMDPALARAAVQLVHGGRVGPKTRQKLKDDYGITKPPRGSKRKKPPGTSSGGGGGPHGSGRLTRYSPDTDTGGAEWREGYERWRKNRLAGPSRRQVA